MPSSERSIFFFPTEGVGRDRDQLIRLPETQQSLLLLFLPSRLQQVGGRAEAETIEFQQCRQWNYRVSIVSSTCRNDTLVLENAIFFTWFIKQIGPGVGDFKRPGLGIAHYLNWESQGGNFLDVTAEPQSPIAHLWPLGGTFCDDGVLKKSVTSCIGTCKT